MREIMHCHWSIMINIKCHMLYVIKTYALFALGEEYFMCIRLSSRVASEDKFAKLLSKYH